MREDKEKQVDTAAGQMPASRRRSQLPAFTVSVKRMNESEESEFITAVTEMLAAAAVDELRRTARKEDSHE